MEIISRYTHKHILHTLCPLLYCIYIIFTYGSPREKRMSGAQPPLWQQNACKIYTHKGSVFSDLDPYHLAGSGSTSGNVDLDPGTKKNRDKFAYKSTKIIKINFKKKKSLILLIYANNKLKISTKKNIVMSFKPYIEKIKKKKILICRIRIHYPGSGSADPDPHKN